MQQSESHDDDIRQVATNVRQKLCGYLEESSRWMRQCLVDGQWSSSRWLVEVAAAARFRWIRHVGPPRTGDRGVT
jgi:hypothetical protein